jgi:hypothetical protein
LSVRAICISVSPAEPAHATAVRDYPLNTACTGDKFILPTFAFNSGVALGVPGDFASSLPHKLRDSPA